MNGKFENVFIIYLGNNYELIFYKEILAGAELLEKYPK